MMVLSTTHYAQGIITHCLLAYPHHMQSMVPLDRNVIYLCIHRIS